MITLEIGGLIMFITLIISYILFRLGGEGE